MLKRMAITGLLALPLVAQGAVLPKGETVCRNLRALSELQQALATGDQHTVDWLFDGAVCIEVPQDTPVEVLAVQDEGFTHLRTTERRRNIELWMAAAPGALQAETNE